MNYSSFFIFLVLILSGFSFSLSQEVETPSFSEAPGFYATDFSLSISHPDPNVTIYYTLDGSSPIKENIGGKIWQYKLIYPTTPEDEFGDLISDTIRTLEYNAPITIRDRSHLPDRYADISTTYLTNKKYFENYDPLSYHQFKGTCVRAVAYKEGVYSEEIGGTFFVSPQKEERYTLPVVCLAVEPDLFFGYENGINVPGKLFDDWRTEYPTAPLNEDEQENMWNAPANFREKGDETESKIYFSYFVEGEEVLSHGAGIRLNGNTSRYYPNKSLRLYAKKEYGPKDFNYQFFEDNPQDKFKRLILRNAGYDGEKTMLRDPFVQQASKNLNTIFQDYQPVIVFINGEYYGLYNLRERYDKKYFNQNFGVDEDELDYIKISEVNEGDREDYFDLLDFLKNHSLEDSLNFEEASKRIDLDNITDYYIVETFMSNLDWPTNNFEYWRKRTTYQDSVPFGHDGRWRWLLKDFDVSVGLRWSGTDVKHNVFENVRYPSGNGFTDNLILPFASLMKNKKFHVDFINRYCDVLNSTYKSEVLSEKLTTMIHKIAPEMDEFTRRWSPQNESFIYFYTVPSYMEWSRNIIPLYEFVYQRQKWVRGYIHDEFDTGELYSTIFAVSEGNAGYIGVNTILINEALDGVNKNQVYPWEGTYFENVPIQIKAIPNPGFKFSHWVGTISGDENPKTLNLTSDSYIKAVFYSEDDEPPSSYIEEQEIIVAPNPFVDRIQFFLDSYEGLTYQLYDLNGINVSSGELSVILNLDFLANGVYILNIISNEGVKQTKIIKL